jgi:hypothetical protein
MKNVLRRLLAPVASPLSAWLDPRLRGIHEHLDISIDQQVRPELHAGVAGIQLALDSISLQVDSLRERLDLFEGRVTADTQTASEFAGAVKRIADGFEDELHAFWEALAGGAAPLGDLVRRSLAREPEAELALAELLRSLVPGAADRVLGTFVGDEGPIGPGMADLLDWAAGHHGPDGQHQLWFNPPVTLERTWGSVRPNEVNERIVELPWAMATCASLEPGSLVLDFGAAESTLALSLASLGYEVLAADLRPYPLAHPRLKALTGPIEEWEGPSRPLDAVFCISAIEHVGLGAYEESPTEGPLDRAIVERFASWLRPGGQLVPTAPYGRWHVDELQRVYDADHLDGLLEGWKVLGREVCIQTAPNRWERVEGEPAASVWDDGTRGVVLVLATPA